MAGAVLKMKKFMEDMSETNRRLEQVPKPCPFIKGWIYRQ